VPPERRARQNTRAVFFILNVIAPIFDDWLAIASKRVGLTLKTPAQFLVLSAFFVRADLRFGTVGRRLGQNFLHFCVFFPVSGRYHPDFADCAEDRLKRAHRVGGDLC